jgi:hypothetical protein
MHLDLTDQTAHLEYILAAVRDTWGSGYVLVISHAIEIEDHSTGKQYGIDFVGVQRWIGFKKEIPMMGVHGSVSSIHHCNVHRMVSHREC